ncbi:hypothetical protein NONO_c30450 [Nocardia nova SH22a]|uniref:Uncharacterized protein n=1 Tax=Nocardia nova SH22a TaxID=1415166 RepID=W5TF27_9NOCA|nr:hypothetical protein NONO_c30450 [Nocardia nova SH22a]
MSGVGPEAKAEHDREDLAFVLVEPGSSRSEPRVAAEAATEVSGAGAGSRA